MFRDGVFVALGIQCEMRMRHAIICGLSGSAIFFHIFSQTEGLKKKLSNVCFNFRC
jgi:hypothetical protein